MKTILVVDDQSEIRKLMRLTLRKSFLIQEAENADFAFKLIQSNPPSAVLLDVMMPGQLSGYELCERIKNNPKLSGIYVVLVSAHGHVIEQELGPLAMFSLRS